MRRRISISAFLCSIAILLFSGTTHAAIDLVHELTIKVPGLSGPIKQAKLGDVDGDGFPEVLVTDGDSVYLYSTTSASFLMVTPVDTLYLIGDMIFDDIDRDSLPDVVFELWPKYTGAQPRLLRGFSSLDNYGIEQTVSFGARLTIIGLGSISDGTLAVVDSDSDGYNELVYSYDSIACSVCFSFIESYVSIGNSFSFQSFPGSISWSGHNVLTDISKARTSVGNSMTIASWYSFSANLGHGPDGSSTFSSLAQLGANGEIIPMPTTNNRVPCYADENNHNTSLEKLVTNGNIDLADNNSELLVRVDWRKNCGRPGVNVIDSTGSHLDLYEFRSIDTLVLLWSRDITGQEFSNFVYMPDFPGSFFAIFNQQVTQFTGSDGSAYQESGLVPAGKLSWEYPYGDNRLRLVALDGDSVSFYFLGIPTAVDDADNSSLPQAFTLNNPYPNPFNPSSIISFTLPERGRVTVSAYNVIGQRVSLLFDSEAPAGRTEIEWNAQSFPSGVYFIRASTETQIRTTKALLLK